MTEPRWDLIHDACVTEDESEPAPETPQQHATTCDLLRGFGWRICNCGLNNEQDVTSLDCA